MQPSGGRQGRNRLRLPQLPAFRRLFRAPQHQGAAGPSAQPPQHQGAAGPSAQPPQHQGAAAPSAQPPQQSVTGQQVK